jgi:NAD-dependent deacetylase
MKQQNNEKILLLQRLIDNSHAIVFFGGAGVSTESGIPDFRSQDGLYNQQWKYPPETILSRTFFDTNTAEFYHFYREKLIIKSAKPNPAHLKLAEMEQKGKLCAVITQNIDGLHQAAGNKTVFELHGSIHRNYCMSCGAFYDADYIASGKHTIDGIPHCTRLKCDGIIKPDVVLYEENLDEKTVSGAIKALKTADLLIIGGTSLSVYPASGLIQYFHGKNSVLINKSIIPDDNLVNLVIHDSIGKVFNSLHI